MNTSVSARRKKAGLRIAAIALLTLGLALIACGAMGVGQTNYHAGMARISQEDWIDYVTGRRQVAPLTSEDYRGKNLKASGREKQRITDELKAATAFDKFVMPRRVLLLVLGGGAAAAGAGLLIASGPWSLAAALGGLGYLALLGYPLFSAFRWGLTDGAGRFSLAALGTALGRRGYFTGALFHSLLLAGAVTALSAALALGFRALLHKAHARLGGVSRFLLLLSAAAAPLMGAFAWSEVFPAWRGFLPCLLCLALPGTGWMLLALSGAEGAPLPKALRASGFLSGALLLFLRCFTDLGAPMLLGGGYMTLPVLLYEEITGSADNGKSLGAVLLLFSLIVSAAVYILWRVRVNRQSKGASLFLPEEAREEFAHGPAGWAFSALAAVCCGAPLLLAAGLSFLRNGAFTFQNYQEMIGQNGPLFLRTLVFTLLCALAAGGVGGLLASLARSHKSLWTALLKHLALFPQAIQGTALGAALLLAFSQRPLLLTGGWALLICASLLLAVPFPLRFSYLRAGTKGGLVRGACAGAAAAWLMLLNEWAAPLFLSGEGTSLAPLEMYRQMMFGQPGAACALAVALLAGSALALGAFLALRGKSGGQEN